MKNKKLLLILAAIFCVAYLLTLGAYPLMDIDETRYVAMARDMFQSGDFMTLWLNGEYFFEKPPLFFWLECFSFWISRGVNEFSARLPIVLLSLLPLGFLFALSVKIHGRKFAFINCAILLTTLEYALITKMAILDSVLTSFVTASVFSYFFTFFIEEKNKKYFWWLTYIFSGLAVLAKGVPGAAIPAIVVLASTVIFKTYKETFRNLPLGILLFLVITLPWHLVMLKDYGALFFDEYIIKHHILRFLGSDVIHRTQPCWFYLVTLLWGLCPWAFSVFRFPKIKFEGNYGKFLTLNIIAAASIFLFFTASKTKLITYILPIYPFLAVLIGHVWYQKSFKTFLAIALSTAILLGIGTPIGHRLDYTFGQNDLMEFAKLAKTQNYTISTYKTGRRYSLNYYSGLKKIDFQTADDAEWLEKELQRPNHLVIARNRDLEWLPFEVKIEKEGKKYSIIAGKN